MRRKLLRMTRRRAADARAAAGPRDAAEPADADADVGASGVSDASDVSDLSDVSDVDLAAQVDRLLDRLQTQGLLSEERFVESRVRARAPAFGARRIEYELAQHGLQLPPPARRHLHDSELQRALQLWQRRFGPALPDDPRERARQARFLAARGFSGDVIRRVLAARGRPLPDDAPDG